MSSHCIAVLYCIVCCTPRTAFQKFSPYLIAKVYWDCTFRFPFFRKWWNSSECSRSSDLLNEVLQLILRFLILLVNCFPPTPSPSFRQSFEKVRRKDGSAEKRAGRNSNTSLGIKDAAFGLTICSDETVSNPLEVVHSANKVTKICLPYLRFSTVTSFSFLFRYRIGFRSIYFRFVAYFCCCFPLAVGVRSSARRRLLLKTFFIIFRYFQTQNTTTMVLSTRFARIHIDLGTGFC